MKARIGQGSWILPLALWIQAGMGALVAPGMAQDGPVLVRHEGTGAPSAPVGTDRYGRAVAVDGSRMIVGAPSFQYMPDFSPGLAFVLEEVGGVWQESAVLTRQPQVDPEMFGAAVDLEGDVAVVGAPWVGPSGSSYGEAWVFELLGGSWNPTAVLEGDTTLVGSSFFGAAVCLRGDRLFVGAPLTRLSLNSTGAVYIYPRVGGAWILASMLSDPDPYYNSRFGSSLDVSEDGLLVVGAPYHDQGSGNGGAGKVYVFRPAGHGWQVDAELIPDPNGTSFYFGKSVAIDGEHLVAGAPHFGGGGRAFLFEYRSGSWSQAARLKAGSAENDDQYGGSVALCGDTALVGASGRQGAGETHVFRSYGGEWELAATLSPSTPNPSAEFGAAVALDAERVLVGASRDGDPDGSGRVHVHRYEDALVPYCAGDGSGAACPCGNAGPAGAGCLNSTGGGARLLGVGTTSVLADDLVLSGHGLPPQQSALLFVGQDTIAGGAGLPFGAGLLCVNTDILRLAVRQVDPAGNVAFGPQLGSLGGWSPGDTRYFQLWYRDPAAGPCSGGFNLSVGLAAEFAR